MVQAIINVSQDVNYVLNIVKAKYNLRDKSQAITLIAKEYMDKLLEPQLKPEVIEKAIRIAEATRDKKPITFSRLREKYLCD